MLKISYKPSADSKEMEKEYETVDDFLQGQYLEVPPLQDHFVVTKVTLESYFRRQRNRINRPHD